MHGTKYSYPYTSTLAAEIKARREAGQHVEEWSKPDVDIKKALSTVEGPIIELAGPTDIGHYYLDGVDLSSRPLLTNIAKGTMFNGEEKGKELDSKIDFLLNGAHLNEIPDNSVGMLIAAHVSAIDESDFDFQRGITKAEDAKYSKRMDTADEAIRKIVQGAPASPELIGASLRLQFATEALRTLRPGGIYLADGSATEKAAFKALGFETLAYINGQGADGEEPHYYMVLQKPGRNE